MVWLDAVHVKAAVGREIATVASMAMCRCSGVHVCAAATSDWCGKDIEQQGNPRV